MNRNVIEETDDFVVFDTGNNYDFISVVMNKTDSDLCFCPYGVWQEFEVKANDWIGLLDDETGHETRFALLNGDYDYCKI